MSNDKAYALYVKMNIDDKWRRVVRNDGLLTYSTHAVAVAVGNRKMNKGEVWAFLVCPEGTNPNKY